MSPFQYAKKMILAGRSTNFRIEKSDVCDVFWLQSYEGDIFGAFPSQAAAEKAKDKALARALKVAA